MLAGRPRSSGWEPGRGWSEVRLPIAPPRGHVLTGAHTHADVHARRRTHTDVFRSPPQPCWGEPQVLGARLFLNHQKAPPPPRIIPNYLPVIRRLALTSLEHCVWGQEITRTKISPQLCSGLAGRLSFYREKLAPLSPLTFKGKCFVPNAKCSS